MTMTGPTVNALVDRELEKISDHRVLSHIKLWRVNPEIIMRDWDYSPQPISYPCWSVMNHAPSNTGIAYCEMGFGPKTPWGLVFLNATPNASMSIGMDSGWFQNFLDAYFESMASADLPIWRVYKQIGDRYPGVPVTDEADWDSTWEDVKKRRIDTPAIRFNCSQSIYKRPE